MTCLLFDADTLVYRFSAGTQKDIVWDDDTASHYADPRIAAIALDDFVEELCQRFNARPVMCLSDPVVNWRHDVLPSYKEQRADFERPVTWADLRAHIERHYRTYLEDRLEGDDLLGLLMTSKRKISGAKVCVSIDKDMKTVPGRHFNPDKGKVFTVTPAQALRFHLFQTLTGDRVDNYKGCPGIGSVRAEALLATSEAEAAPGAMDWYPLAWSRILEAFENKGLTKDDALVQARVARILQDQDYDWHEKTISYWYPPII